MVNLFKAKWIKVIGVFVIGAFFVVPNPSGAEPMDLEVNSQGVGPIRVDVAVNKAFLEDLFPGHEIVANTLVEAEGTPTSQYSVKKGTEPVLNILLESIDGTPRAISVYTHHAVTASNIRIGDQITTLKKKGADLNCGKIQINRETINYCWEGKAAHKSRIFYIPKDDVIKEIKWSKWHSVF